MRAIYGFPEEVAKGEGDGVELCGTSRRYFRHRTLM
jgi:hypothetical protein